MTKILLVEDDTSLREIYGVRLLAEGYDIVSADNGEEALAVAIKERPNLIITDVMMPKISGFDMLDILRSTTETRDIKVIMMTALGSDENRERSERLGADRYLVKSQVGIEDVVRAVHDLLGDAAQAAQGATATAAPAVPAQPTVGRSLVSAPAVAAPGAPSQTIPTAQPLQQATPVSAQVPAAASAADSPSRRARVIQPINDPSKSSIDLQALVDKELAKEGSGPVASEAQQREIVATQLDSFVNTPAQASASPAPAPSSSDASAHVPPASDPAAAPISVTAATATPPASSAPSQLPPIAPPAQQPVTDTGAAPALPAMPPQPQPAPQQQPAQTPAASPDEPPTAAV